MNTELTFGAVPVPGGVRFRVWAPAARELTLVLRDGRAAGSWLMGRDEAGVHDRIVPGAAAGDRYAYNRRRRGRPDPASRSTRRGAGFSKSSSEDVRWTREAWRTRPRPSSLQLHIGTFSGGNPMARRLTVRSAISAHRERGQRGDFAGMRNWGYDGLPSRAIARLGRPTLPAPVDTRNGSHGRCVGSKWSTTSRPRGGLHGD